MRLTPRARADRIDGIATDPAGAAVLRIAVTAPPAEGRANNALLALLAKACNVPRRDLTIALGSGSRDKVVAVAGDPAQLMRKLSAVLAI